jgi:hypothetical protein
MMLKENKTLLKGTLARDFLHVFFLHQNTPPDSYPNAVSNINSK